MSLQRVLAAARLSSHAEAVARLPTVGPSLASLQRRTFAAAKKGKGKEKAAPKFKSVQQGYGHGAEDRPPRQLVRVEERAKRLEALRKSGVLSADAKLTGKPQEDDPVLAGLLARAEAETVMPLEADKFAEDMGGWLEEPRDIAALAATRRFSSALRVPDKFKGRFAVVPNTDDVASLTDIEAEEPEEEMLDNIAAAGEARVARGAPILPSVSRKAEADAQASEMAAALLRDTEVGRRMVAGGGALAGIESMLLGPEGPDGGALRPEELAGLKDARLAELLHRRMLGADEATDAEEEAERDIAWEPEEGKRLQGVHGDDPRSIPRGILEEWATPTDFYPGSLSDSESPIVTEREAAMTRAERSINEKRKRLRDLIEKPLPIATRPLWPLHSLIVGADIVRQVVSGGVIDSTRCMVVVGNGQGGIGVGMAKHRDPFACTKRALQLAQRDMIHVATHKGQLYHDLIGRKNNVYVAIRAMPAGSSVLKAAPMLMDVFELAGIKAASAKTFGSHRRNPYIVTQALFDAFNHHVAPEESAARRGLRMVWATSDRVNPRTIYPYSPPGPRFPATNDRYVRGNMRA